jgi:hypothetical protein
MPQKPPACDSKKKTGRFHSQLPAGRAKPPALFLGLQAFLCEVGLGDCTAKARRTRSKEFFIKKVSDLCELGASVVNTSSQKTRNNLIF